MKALLLVGLGGALGSIARYAIAVLTLQSVSVRFPWGTFAVNVIGCLVAGVLLGLSEKHAWFDAQTRLFLFTGVLGGFTTFSAFGLDALTLLRRDEWMLAALYIAGSVLLGLAAAWFGLRLVLR